MNTNIDNRLVIKAPAKINLHLEVLGKRNDGFHELAMVMQSINLVDVLEMEISNDSVMNLSINCNDLSNNEDNLIIKAAKYLIEYVNNQNLGANIYLKKNIPIGAGLAGGSSDAAATLIGLNKLWSLNLTSREIHKIAAKIGSDVPFCLDGGSQFCFGRGEILEQFKQESSYGLLLIKNPSVSLSTAEIYSQYSNQYNHTFISSEENFQKRRNQLLSKGFQESNIFINKINIQNDLQNIAIRKCNSVRDGLTILKNLENVLAYSMSGSGPSCYAIFENIKTAKETYKKNKDTFLNYGFKVWICDFLNHGVKFIN